MDKRLLNLQTVLQELGIDTGIETIGQRVTLQKAIYLVQAVGIPCITGTIGTLWDHIVQT